MEISDNRITEVNVVRGAPCGATQDAAESIIGIEIDAADSEFGLKTQFFCSADPSKFDPIHGKSPVHFAADVHALAINRAIKKAVAVK